MKPVLCALTALALTASACAADFNAGLFPSPMDRLYQPRIECESADWLTIYLFDAPLDPTKLSRPELYSITSPDDAHPAGVHPAVVSVRSRTVRVAERRNLLVKGTVIFLKLPAAMENGKTYAVAVGDVGSPLPALAPVIFDDRRIVSDNIRLNQVGYLPGWSKVAYLGQYTGAAGGMEFSARSFELLDADGRSVFKGEVKRRNVHDELVGQAVCELDFSVFDTPGTYRIFVPGVGVSYPFDIGPKALNPIFANLMRGSYLQRCGDAIDASVCRHDRPACHLDDAYLEERVAKLKFVATTQPLYPQAYDNQRHPTTRGHHDAGDYGKYVSSGATYVFSILLGMELFPEKLSCDNLGLPYSGNGIPDLVDECKWQLDWLENMQDTDGGVWGVILPNTGGYENGMPPAENHRLLFPKDTVFTGAYAAALAHAARSPLMRKFYPRDCQRYLVKAIRAWEWLEQNHTYVRYFHYGAEFGDWDERCWAAIELYAATGQEKYHQYFLKEFDPGQKRWGWWGLFECVGHAAEAYAFLPDKPRDAAMLKRCKAAIIEAADTHVREAAEFPYRMSMPGESIRHGTYGWVFPSSLFGYELLCAYALDAKREYLQCALDNLSYELGANPSGSSLQTGLGAKRNIEVVHNQSSFDGIIEAAPGLPLGIGSHNFYWLDRYGRKIGEGEYPANWPLLNRWYDGFNVQTEFTIDHLIREAVVAAYFANIPADATPAPSVKITAPLLTGPAPLKVAFSLQAASTKQVFWDFDDESFSASPSPVHTFDQPGREYHVAATIVDEDGRLAYDTVRVACAATQPADVRTEFSPDDKTVALYHFSGDLKDATGRSAELSAKVGVNERRPWRFTKEAPLWMTTPNGSALELDGREQLILTIPAAKRPVGGPISVELMLYLREFVGWGYEGNPILLGLQQDNDHWFGWRQETWERSNTPFAGTASGRIVSTDKFAADFPRHRWCHVKLTDDGKGTVTFYVDGQPWGSGPTAALVDKRDMTLFVGPFRGMIDELRVTATAP